MSSSKNSLISLSVVHDVYKLSDTPLTNDELYHAVASTVGLPSSALIDKTAVGKSKVGHNLIKRKIRWYQQTLKAAGVLNKVPGKRGVWELANPEGKELNAVPVNVSLLAYSTELGAAIWSDCNNVFDNLNTDIHLCITSPPYPLKVKRQYGNVDERKWADFLVGAIEPIACNLVDGGSIVINISNDIFNSKQPSRSLYIERMVLALHDELDLHLMDRIPWVNLSKPPGPTWWACRERVQLCAGWEPIYWFTNNPDTVNSDNRRVLEPHSERHMKLLAKGGEDRVASYGDGAYKLRETSFSNKTKGKIPKNIIQRGHACSDTKAIRAHSDILGLPKHSAMFPSSIPEFFIKFLTEPGQTVVDPFSGSNKVGLCAERLGRKWVVTERILEYIRVQAEMFKSFNGFSMNDEFTL